MPGWKHDLLSQLSLFLPAMSQNSRGQRQTPDCRPVAENHCVTGLTGCCGYLFCCYVRDVFPCNISTQQYVHGFLLQTATLMGWENWRWFDWIAFVSCNVYIMRILLHRLHVAESVATYSLRITWITMITTPHKNRHCVMLWGQAPKW
jgi:hypothetical protein